MFRDRPFTAEKLYYFAQVHSQFPSTFANNIQVMKMCSAFGKAGIQTILIVPRRPGTKERVQGLDASLWDFFSVQKNFEIRWCSFPYPFKRLEQSLYALFVLFYTLLRNVRGVIYTRSDWIALLLSMLGNKVILELHSYEKQSGVKFITRMAKLNRNLLALICISESLAKRIAKIGFPEEKINICHDGVDLELYEPRLERGEARIGLNLPLDVKIACHVGHLYEGRGFTTMLEAAVKLPHILFVMVGGNQTDIERCKSLAESRNIDNIIFIGHISQKKVPRYLFAADVLLMPYTKKVSTHQYMSPMKLFEYMAAERPIIASDFPVLHEVLTNNKNAIFVTPGDPIALAGAIKSVIENKTFGENLGRMALSDVKQYTWQKRADKILEFLLKSCTVN